MHKEKTFKELVLDDAVFPSQAKTFSDDSFRRIFARYRDGKGPHNYRHKAQKLVVSGVTVPLDSYHEVVAYETFDKSNEVTVYQRQPYLLSQTGKVTGSRSIEYCPDMVVLTNEGKIVLIEVKPIVSLLLSNYTPYDKFPYWDRKACKHQIELVMQKAKIAIKYCSTQYCGIGIGYAIFDPIGEYYSLKSISKNYKDRALIEQLRNEVSKSGYIAYDDNIRKRYNVTSDEEMLSLALNAGLYMSPKCNKNGYIMRDKDSNDVLEYSQIEEFSSPDLFKDLV